MPIKHGDAAWPGATVAFDAAGRPSACLTLVPLDDLDWDDPRFARPVPFRANQPALVGVAATVLPATAAPFVSSLTTTLVASPPEFPEPTWVECANPSDTGEILAKRARDRPRAVIALDGALRLASSLSVEEGVIAESFAYSTLLAGPEFSAWRTARPRKKVPTVPEPVALERHGSTLNVRLNHPARRNAFSAHLRNQVVEAFNLVDLDPSIREVILTGEGPMFSSGGDLDEFGSSPEPATAHLIRLNQSAGLAVHRVADRVTAVLHGTCIGAGIEVPAFAHHVAARDGSAFQLPELDLGLIPGAGGTVSLTKRIGRWRTAFMVLTGEGIDLDTALDWKLVDERV